MILKFGVRTVLSKIQRYKAIRLVNVVTEILTALDDLMTDKISDVLNKIYDSVKILLNSSWSIFITLLKKPNANIYELNGKISLISHIPNTYYSNKTRNNKMMWITHVETLKTLNKVRSDQKSSLERKEFWIAM